MLKAKFVSSISFVSVNESSAKVLGISLRNVEDLNGEARKAHFMRLCGRFQAVL